MTNPFENFIMWLRKKLEEVCMEFSSNSSVPQNSLSKRTKPRIQPIAKGTRTKSCFYNKKQAKLFANRFSLVEKS